MEKMQVIKEETAAKNPAKKEGDSLSPQETALISKMMELGVFYGHSKSRTNPKMRKYILGNRSGFSVIDLRKTVSKLADANKLVKTVVAKGGVVLMVGTSPSVKGSVKKLSEELGIPYVTERWLGGTLTNFETISKRIKYLKQLKEEQKDQAWDKYTKKEQLNKERELDKLDKLFGGIETLEKIPNLMIVIDPTKNEAATREAKALNIPVLGLLNTDANPNLVTIGVPANDKNIRSVEFLVNEIKNMILEARKVMPKKEIGEVKEEVKEND